MVLLQSLFYLAAKQFHAGDQTIATNGSLKNLSLDLVYGQPLGFFQFALVHIRTFKLLSSTVP